jgi:hypothetical protein
MIHLRKAWSTFKLPCSAITALVSQSLDRDLPLLERWAVRVHLLYCVACHRFRYQIRFLRQALSRAPEHLDELVPGPSMPAEVRERLLKILGKK